MLNDTYRSTKISSTIKVKFTMYGTKSSITRYARKQENMTHSENSQYIGGLQIDTDVTISGQ